MITSRVGTRNSDGKYFFIKVLKERALLAFEYEVCCTQLAENAAELQNRALTFQHLTTTLMIAEILEYMYTVYLFLPSEAARLRREEQAYRHLLTEYHSSSDAIANYKVDNLFFFIQKIRDITTQYNFPRVLMTRIKQILNTLDKIIFNIKYYHRVVVFFNAYVDPILSYLVWIFFTPRLLCNLGLLITDFGHIKSLGWKNNLAIQWDFRWFELMSDAVWVLVGLGNCFVLVGVLAPCAPYLTLFRHLCDVILNSLKAYFEINRLTHLKQTYFDLLQRPIIFIEDRSNVVNYFNHLEKRLKYEKHRYYARALSSLALFFAIVMTLPLFSSTPIIPLLGAILATVITLFSSELEPKKDVNFMKQLNKLSLFKYNSINPQCPKNYDYHQPGLR